MPQPKADVLLNQVYERLGLLNTPEHKRYMHIPGIVAELQKINSKERISVGTTGTISERLCVLGLEEVMQSRPKIRHRKFGADWKWLGDILVPGHPYDLAISIKSFKAKERLLASGTGSLLTPTIGWGLFDDPKEWSENRARSYLFRGFIAIYMPAKTLSAVSDSSRAILNPNRKPLLRDLVRFPRDLVGAIRERSDRVDVRSV